MVIILERVLFLSFAFDERGGRASWIGIYFVS